MDLAETRSSPFLMEQIDTVVIHSDALCSQVSDGRCNFSQGLRFYQSGTVISYEAREIKVLKLEQFR